LATPVNKLGAAPPASSQQRDPGSEVSYQDLLRKHEEEGGLLNSNRDTSLVNTQMAQMGSPMPPPPAEELMPPGSNYAHGGPGGGPRQPYDDMGSQPYDYGPQGPQGYQDLRQAPPPPPPAQPKEDEPPKPWWKTFVLQNKMGWIAALVVFVILTFVYPKIRAMPRFAQHPQMPHWVVGIISILAAACMTSIHVAI